MILDDMPMEGGTEATEGDETKPEAGQESTGGDEGGEAA